MAEEDDTNKTSFPGFLAYLVSNCAFYYSSTIREQYAARHRGLTPTVQFNDIAFAAHALVLSCITTSQYVLPALWSFPATGAAVPTRRSRPSRPILGVALGCLLGVAATSFIVIVSSSSSSPASPLDAGAALPRAFDPQTDWCALDIVYAVSYVKLLVTLVKFTPQVLANFRNASTRGWSIWQILLDVTGGVLSIAQQGIDSYLQRDWSGITGNPVKFALGNVSMVYDAIFMWQHYVLYPEKNLDIEEAPLLGETRPE
jgi:cystinosin